MLKFLRWLLPKSNEPIVVFERPGRWVVRSAAGEEPFPTAEAAEARRAKIADEEEELFRTW